MIAGGELLLGSLIGFMAVFALAVRQNLLMLHHLQALEREGEGFGPGLVHRGTRERLGAILTSTTALALLALVFVLAGDGAGFEVLHPMAVVMLGGLVTSAFVTLFLLPALHLHVATPLRPGEDGAEGLAAGERPDIDATRAPADAPRSSAGLHAAQGEA
jgi:Cu/Ag efflux pump CusA